MDRIGTDQHPDYLADTGQRLGQSLAVLATLGEAAARLAAVEIRRRQWREAQDDRRRERHGQQPAGEGTPRPSPTSPETEARNAARRDRRLIARALDAQWLAAADLYDLAITWRTARLREPQFEEARGVASLVEDRLREFYPRPMRGYDEAVADGMPRPQAMRAAVEEMARTPVMRAHGGRRSAAISPGSGVTVTPDELDAAIRNERARLAAGLTDEVYRDLHRLGAAGRAAADHLRQMLDAHQATAQATRKPNSAGQGEGTTTAPTPPQMSQQWYPQGTQNTGVLPGHVARLRPANVSGLTNGLGGNVRPTR
ncbi:hypothetical protein ACIA8K_39555 [Catenuloplanes sp. NPDC051500]|uniref:hypothetical protein n=1 Tax=Catenuloplanes sp. NPDC051500 TaxID=3363959 RepID=UPI0037911A45